MIKREHIPDSVEKEAWEYFDGSDMKEAIAAAINAWPGADREHAGVCCNPKGSIILPLPQEKSND